MRKRWNEALLVWFLFKEIPHVHQFFISSILMNERKRPTKRESPSKRPTESLRAQRGCYTTTQEGPDTKGCK